MKTTKYVTALVFALACEIGFAQQPVEFRDANLKSAVETELGISDPTPVDMLSLTYLDARKSRIADLGGLEFAINLKSLRLNQNKISEISVPMDTNVTPITKGEIPKAAARIAECLTALTLE